MRVPRIYLDAPLETGALVPLPAKQSSYLCRVLRMQEGRSLRVFNGLGGAYSAEISRAHPKEAELRIGDFDDRNPESPLSIELGIALSKGDRFDYALQKATELGVSQIQPLQTDRVDGRFNAVRLAKKMLSWQAIVVSACEQSGRNKVPLIMPVKSIEDWCLELSASTRIVLDPMSAGTRLNTLDKPADLSAALLIGPEGGLTETEIQHATEQGFQAMGMGPRILRTETAPLSAISIMQSLWGDI